MPSLFNRRSRSVSTSRPTQNASSSAHVAAAQAFLASQKTQPNISASAAAAALRTMSPTPTPVDQVQTRRMMNRQASNASASGAPRGRPIGSMQRRTSSGSMTGRTFRSPSPSSSSPQIAPVPVPPAKRANAPPVPPLPSNYASENYLPATAKSRRRSASVDMQPTRMTSPPPVRPTGRGQGLDRSASGAPAAALGARRAANIPQAQELQRSDSQESNSINYSYPRGSRPNSPPPTRSSIAPTSETLPSSGPSGLSAAEMAQIQHKLDQTAAKPVKAKKKRVDPSAVEGSHLHAGTMGAKPTVTPLTQASADRRQPQEEESVKKSKKKAALTGQMTHFVDNRETHTGSEAESDSDAASDQMQERRAKRAAGVLAKQPSVVREDWEGEQEVEQEFHDSLPEAGATRNMTASPSMKKSYPEANMSRKIEDLSGASKSASVVHDAVTLPATKAGGTKKSIASAGLEAPSSRGVSISPSRSTRFSERLTSDLGTGRKHDPPGRSISPAKSALKHASPAASEASPSDRQYSARRGSSLTPSEASDTSMDGALTRRKSNRVSFEAVPQVIDTAKESSSSKDSEKKGWLTSTRAKSSTSDATVPDEDVEEGMKPRPALPSFGSVRRSERSESPVVKEPSIAAQHMYAHSPSSSEASSLADPPTMDTSISSDHALGSMLSKQSQINSLPAQSQTENKALGRKTDLAKVSGYASDSDDLSSDEDEHSLQAAQAASKQLRESVGNEKSTPGQSEDIPVIAVQPATPGVDESQPREEWIADLPGGFPASGEQSRRSSDVDIVEPVDDYSSQMSNEPPQSPTYEQLMTIEEEDSDDIYSDAAEDLSDLEGDGFGSINAIVESPVVTSQKQRQQQQKRNNSIPDSPSSLINQHRPQESERTTSWDDTQAHWSGLAQRFREDNQVSKDITEISVSNVGRDPAPRKEPKTKTKTVQTVTAVPAKPAVPVKSAMRQTQAQSPPPVRDVDQSPVPTTVQKRPSQAKQQAPLKSSMRGSTQSAVAPPQTTPVSRFEAPPAPRTNAQKRTTLRAAATPPATAPKPPVRRFSNESDSDSSFRKARRGKANVDNRYTMRTSMRSRPAETGRPSVASRRNEVRSLSPVNRRPTSSMGMKSMRTSMRGRESVDTDTPTLRGQPEVKRSSSLFSFNRKAKSPSRAPLPLAVTPPVPSITSKVKSRIADSDDEDGPRQNRYKSRFADSSDEDEPQKLRPVRGIPRRKDEGDSTDLDDSSDDGRRAKPAATTIKKPTIAPPSASEPALSPPASPTTAKKRGLWGRIRGKKKDEASAEPNGSLTIAEREDTQPKVEPTKEDSENAQQLGFSTTAERDALIEQTRRKLEAGKERPASPAGKLTKRAIPQRVFSDSWAPPRLELNFDDPRPNTAGNISTARPEIGDRRPTSETLGTNADSTAYGKGGAKKKKFSMLRKAFRLDV